MKRSEIYIPSADGKTNIHGYIWAPDEGPVKAVVQLAHGMQEYIDRYEPFAEFLTGEGYGVIGHDHLGHGKSIAAPEDLSFFAEKKGMECVLRDMHHFTLRAKKEWPGKKVFLLGHSMGSFFTRRYITLYPKEVSGVILSGTGDQPYLLAHFGKRLAGLLRLIKGSHYHSPLIEKMALGGFGKLEDWLCSRSEIVEAYKADPLCGQMFTVGAYQDFFRLLEQLAAGDDQEKVPAELPILLAAGMKDPVGACSKGVLAVYNRYRAQGLKDVDIFLYKDDLHEILNETDRAEVMDDIERWIRERL